MKICLELPHRGDQFVLAGSPEIRKSITRLSITFCVAVFMLILLSASLLAQIPHPKDSLGFTPGDDRKLASWAQVVDYFKKLDAASERMIFEEIGKTTMGAPFVFATVSSPENLKNLEKYKQINAKLADPRKFKSNDSEAKKLIAQGKTIVLITFGIHSTEVGSTLSSMLIAHRLLSSDEPEIKAILDNTIILLVPSLNPDGVDIVKNWYDKTLGTPYEGTSPPELYHKYVGHDNNRDWYAFTQVETQLTVDKIHNVWHPQIVHDVHQQGSNGSRLFLPPYMAPVEPNVPPQIVEGFTELGNFMASDLRKKGFEGITTNTTYDAWTPARAYSHYHGGVRILSETASARLASPITIKFDDLRGGVGGLDAKKESDKFGPVWKGGEWTIRDITNYMTSAAFSLLNHAANNRETWLTRFYQIGKEAVRPRKAGELFGFLIDRVKPENQCGNSLVDILRRGGVEINTIRLPNRVGNGTNYSSKLLVRTDQPYANFAKALLESQHYPDLRDELGHPINPYDVTAHTMSMLMTVETQPVKAPFNYQPQAASDVMSNCRPPEPVDAKLAIYKSFAASMDEGWSRWILETNGFQYSTLFNQDLRKEDLAGKVQTIIFPDQSPNQILNGYAKGSMPDEYTGGVGKEGVEHLRKFVEAGGTLVFLNRASLFAIEQFKLPIINVTAGLDRKDFFIPGSILRTELDTTHPVAAGMPKESIAWFENSPAFEVNAERVGSPTVREGSTSDGNERGALTDVRATDTSTIRIIARYPSDPKQILLSGWALGAEKIAGKAALVEVAIGKGKIILFGFRPQYRGQSLATFPLLFNAISR